MPDQRESTPADVILAQLGGNRFIAMTGAKHVFSDAGGMALVFKLPRLTYGGINAVRVELTPADTYTMTFTKVGNARSGHRVETIAEVENVYADSLRQVFESKTGLATSLGTLGADDSQ